MPHKQTIPELERDLADIESAILTTESAERKAIYKRTRERIQQRISEARAAHAQKGRKAATSVPAGPLQPAAPPPVPPVPGGIGGGTASGQPVQPEPVVPGGLFASQPEPSGDSGAPQAAWSGRGVQSPPSTGGSGSAKVAQARTATAAQTRPEPVVLTFERVPPAKPAPRNESGAPAPATLFELPPVQAARPVVVSNSGSDIYTVQVSGHYRPRVQIVYPSGKTVTLTESQLFARIRCAVRDLGKAKYTNEGGQLAHMRLFHSAVAFEAGRKLITRRELGITDPVYGAIQQHAQ